MIKMVKTGRKGRNGEGRWNTGGGRDGGIQGRKQWRNTRGEGMVEYRGGRDG